MLSEFENPIHLKKWDVIGLYVLLFLTAQSSLAQGVKDELQFVARRQQTILVTFASSSVPAFHINILDRSGQRSSAFYKVGDTTHCGRFKILEFEQKESWPGSLNTDASELTIEQLSSGRTWVLVRGVKTATPIYFAEFNTKGGKTIYVKEGDGLGFHHLNKSYRLTAVSEDAATLTGVDGEIVVLEKQ